MVSSNSTVSCVTIADLRAQRRQRHVADVDAVDQDRAARDVVEPRNQVDQRRLARAAQADDARPSARRGRVNDTSAARTASGSSSYAKPTSRNSTPVASGAQRRRAGLLAHLGVGVEHLEDALRRRRSPAAGSALTRLSFLTGPYIMNAAARNDDELARRQPAGRDLAGCRTRARPTAASAAEELHERRQRRQRARDLHVRAVQQLRRAG